MCKLCSRFLLLVCLQSLQQPRLCSAAVHAVSGPRALCLQILITRCLVHSSTATSGSTSSGTRGDARASLSASSTAPSTVPISLCKFYQIFNSCIRKFRGQVGGRHEKWRKTLGKPQQVRGWAGTFRHVQNRDYNTRGRRITYMNYENEQRMDNSYLL